MRIEFQTSANIMIRFKILTYIVKNFKKRLAKFVESYQLINQYWIDYIVDIDLS